MKYEEIVIEIEESLDANKNFKINNLLQTKAIEKIKKLVKNRLEKLEDSKKLNDRKHDVITILGERGTGKTSLLLNLETILEDSKDELVFLRIIDPTLFETKQNILVSIISLIADEIKNANKSKDDKWNESLIKLADGLKLLDGVGSDIIKSDLFDDGELILEKGLDHAHSGLNLEKNFNNFISKSLSLLDNKEMFVLVFDDIDTNIDKGWIVLETIRKYLTSSQLQVFVSGDWELFSSLVRMKQWENFDRKILPVIEWESKVNLVDDLEEQYLIKVLKPEYRIYLENLYHLTTKLEYPTICIKYIENNNKTIDSIYEEISEKLFNFKNKKHQTEISNLIKFLPIRTNMKILYLFVQNQNNHIEMINEISNVFVTNTARFNFTHLDYENLSTNSVLQEMAKKLYLISNDKFSFSDLSQFPMNLSDKNINLLLMVINLHLSNTINTNIHTFFEWLTRFTYLEILGKNKQKEDEKNELLSELKYDTSISMAEQIDLISSEYIEQNTQSSLLLGYRSTYAFNRYASKHGFIGVDNIKEEFKMNEKFLFSILSSKSGEKGHFEQTNVSIINLFSFIHEFLQKDNEEAKNFLTEQFKVFHELQNGEIHLLEATIEEEIYQSSIYKSLLEWHKLKNNISLFSITQINDIWSNFIRQQFKIQNQKFDSVKDFVKYQIIYFLNMLIVEVIKNKNKSKAYNVINTPAYLYNNIEKAYGENYEKDFFHSYEQNKLDLFKYMYSCPILHCFLDDKKFIKPDYWIGDKDKDNIITLFSRLGIQGGNTMGEEKEPVDNSIHIIKYISMSDLRKVTYRDVSTMIKIIDQIKNGEIDSVDKLWNEIKPPKKRITTEREAILNRFLSNVQDDIEADDSSTH